MWSEDGVVLSYPEVIEVNEDAEAASDESMEREDVASASREQQSESGGLSLVSVEVVEGDILSRLLHGMTLALLHKSPPRSKSCTFSVLFPATEARFSVVKLTPGGA